MKEMSFVKVEDPAVGGDILLNATDPGSIADFPSWAKTSGNEILKTEQDGEVIKFYIKRSA